MKMAIAAELEGRFKANSIRVSAINVSCIDLTVQVARETTEAEVSQILDRATYGSLEGIMGFTSEPRASIDFNPDSRSCVIDGTQTQVTSGQLIKSLCWYGGLPTECSMWLIHGLKKSKYISSSLMS